jgi:hypothetical protein
MANQRIGNETRMNLQTPGSSYGWQKGTQPNQSDNGKTRQTRAELVSPSNSGVIQDGNR